MQQTGRETTELGTNGTEDRERPPAGADPMGGHGSDVTTIGVVGLGTMGGSIAGRLLSLGYEVYGTNRTSTRAQYLREQGLRWSASPRELAESVDVVISMVTDGDALESVTAGPTGILAGLTAGKIYIDMSTVSPESSAEVAGKVAARGAAMLAAPVSGSVPAVKNGTLAIMVGGDADAYSRAEPILAQLGSAVTFVGDNGDALLLKLAVNISLAVQMLAFSEGVLLAERGGIDRALALRVLTSSAIGSPMLAARAPMLLDLPDTAWFDVAMMHKDLGLALETARQLHIPLPSTTAADEMLRTAGYLGYEHSDIAAMFEVLSGITAAPAEPQLQSAAG